MTVAPASTPNKAASADAAIVEELRALDRDGWRELLASRPTVPLWPHAGVALDVSRPCAYRQAGTSIPCLRVGRAIRVSSAWLAEALGLDSSR